MKRLRIILAEDVTLHEMLLGILISNIFILLVGMIFCDDRLKALIGSLSGMMVACIYTIHMAVTLDDAMCLDEHGAAVTMRKNMLIRYAFVCIVVAVISHYEIGNPILCILGCMTIKLGAYCQPYIHRLTNRRDKH